MPLHLDAGLEPIAGYTLARCLGRGGFGEVWEANAPGGVRVALKFIRLGTTEAGSEQRALEVIRDIRHPHLLDVQFARRVEDCLVIAMPLCDESLMDRLRAVQAQGRLGLPRDELLVYMNDLARALDFLNLPGENGRVGIQHRDIKPHNIFLVGGSVRLADFGLAKIVEAGGAPHTGAMSPNYVAPEVLESRLTQWTDQYSLAITYFQLRTGRMPYAGRSVNQILYAHIHENPDLGNLPEAEAVAIGRALAKCPEHRWPTCCAFARALEAAARRDEQHVDASRGTTLVQGAPSSFGPPEDANYTVLPTTHNDPVPPSDFEAAAPAVTVTVPDAPRGRWLPRAGVTGLAATLFALAGLALFARSGPTPRSTPRPVPIPPVRVEAARPTPAPNPPIERERPGSSRTTTKEPRENRPETAAIPPVAPPAEAETRPLLADSRDVEKATPVSASVPAVSLARPAHAILKKYCYRCHGIRFEVPGYNVLDRDVLVAKRGEEEPPYVVPGKPDASNLWERMGVERDMPPSGPKPSDADRSLISRWIEAGAPFPEVDPVTRPRRTERDVLAAIRDHLRRARPADRPFLRYFSLHNLYNSKDVDDAELRLARAAVAKLINGLSWKSEIVVPETIDGEQVVLALDLRDVGWDERDLWFEILARYPYGLKHDQDSDAELRAMAAEVYASCGTVIPYLRADWFIANASRPPLYHILLDMPKDDRSLEDRLGVDVVANFLKNKIARAGFASSGVSSQNRMVERHGSHYGGYWKSYDFKKNEGKGNLFRFPLGPVFGANPYPHQAFEHAGGEIIFNLPNGLQGYLLVDGEGHRIDAGPIEVVSDALRTSGTAAIVDGLSCMACHRQGIIPFQDTVRDGLAIAGAAREKAEDLYVLQAVMDKLQSADEARFLHALDAATGAFLKVGEDAGKTIRDFPEPIGALARAYLKDLGPVDVASDLGFNDPKALTDLIRANLRLREFGLAPLLRNAAIKRTEWDSLEGRFLSRFQEVARELELGTPFRSF